MIVTHPISHTEVTLAEAPSGSVPTVSSSACIMRYQRRATFSYYTYSCCSCFGCLSNYKAPSTAPMCSVPVVLSYYTYSCGFCAGCLSNYEAPSGCPHASLVIPAIPSRADLGSAPVGRDTSLTPLSSETTCASAERMMYASNTSDAPVIVDCNIATISHTEMAVAGALSGPASMVFGSAHIVTRRWRRAHRTQLASPTMPFVIVATTSSIPGSVPCGSGQIIRGRRGRPRTIQLVEPRIFSVETQLAAAMMSPCLPSLASGSSNALTCKRRKRAAAAVARCRRTPVYKGLVHTL